jgi:hypothetical protein
MMSKQAPVFQSVFGENWERIPPVIRKRYAITPYSEERVTVEGTMDVHYSWLFRMLLPLMRLFGALVPYQGNGIPVTVHFHSEPNSDAFCFDRIFRFPNRTPYHFRSRMFQEKGDTIIEYMRFGLGIKFRYEYDGNKTVYLRHAGYFWKIAGVMIPVPITLLLGEGYGEEIATSETSFDMRAGTKHLLFGTSFEYRGTFIIA